MQLNFPQYQFNIKKESGKELVFDELRRKFIVATPEEMVRQHLIRFLIEERSYPKALISIEKEVVFNQMNRRVDAIVYSSLTNQPLVLIECKSPKVKLRQEVFEQIGRYNMVLKVPYLLVTNGLKHFFCEVDWRRGSSSFLKEIPAYSALE